MAKVTRREFIGGIAATGAVAGIGFGTNDDSANIDRYALVSRHNPVMRKLDPMSPLSVGNGEFAFTCDITGLQTFPDAYKDAMPLCTMSQWGWHSKPMPEHLKGKQLKLNEYDTYGRKVGYMTTKTGQEELFDYLRENPHRLHLGQIGFDFGSDAKLEDITDIEQKLDLWAGIIHSRFKFKGGAVYVQTVAHPNQDSVGIRVESPLIRDRRLAIRVTFPYGSQTMQAADWTEPEKHESHRLVTYGDRGITVRRRLDGDEYHAQILADRGSVEQTGAHEFTVRPSGTVRLDCCVSFFKKFQVRLVDTTESLRASQQQWQGFWTTGAAVDFSGSKDPRAKELERRVTLSQYQTAIQCAGSTPPQETGLTTNSWYGKYHLEMHWWHAAQFALWNRFPLLERSLNWYNKVLPSARERAKSQGYKGLGGLR